MQHWRFKSEGSLIVTSLWSRLSLFAVDKVSFAWSKCKTVSRNGSKSAVSSATCIDKPFMMRTQRCRRDHQFCRNELRSFFSWCEKLRQETADTGSRLYWYRVSELKIVIAVLVDKTLADLDQGTNRNFRPVSPQGYFSLIRDMKSAFTGSYIIEVHCNEMSIKAESSPSMSISLHCQFILKALLTIWLARCCAPSEIRKRRLLSSLASVSVCVSLD